jgi:excisionase family DNA binding protein
MYTTAEVAKKVGICKSTLLRWIHEGLMTDVGRDWRGWRIWSDKDINKAKAFMKAYHSEPIKRIRRRPINRVDCAKAAAQSMGGFAKGYFPRPGVGI